MASPDGRRDVSVPASPRARARAALCAITRSSDRTPRRTSSSPAGAASRASANGGAGSSAGSGGGLREGCRLREFLAHGLWPIEMPDVAPCPPTLTGMRPATDQALRVLRLTGGVVHVVRDASIEDAAAERLGAHLDLDAEVPPDLLSQYEAAAASARFFAPLSEANLHAALSAVYALVNRIVVDPGLRRDAANAHLWAAWNLEGDMTYLARGVDGGDTATSGTADGACIAQNSAGKPQAIAILETKIAALFLTFQRTTFHDILSQQGFTVYLTAGNRLRAWNSPLVDGCASFWVGVVAQMWESMHVYQCDTLILTSWQRSGLLRRQAHNVLATSFLLPWGAQPVVSSGRIPLNLLHVVLALALCNLDDGLERWERFPGAPPVIPRVPPLPEDQELPPTIPTAVHGWDRQSGDNPASPTSPTASSACTPSVVHLFQTLPGDDGTLAAFLERSTGHELRLGECLGRGQVYASFRVRSTTLATGKPMVAKLVDLALLPLVDTRWSLSRAAVQKQVRGEAQLYCGPLAALQGVTVPRFYGLFEGHIGRDRGVMVMLLEDVGAPLARVCADLSPKECAEVVAVYSALHAAHVVHGAASVQHVRRAGNQLRVQDFENAWSVNPGSRREMADLHDEHRCMLREFGAAVPAALREITPPWEMDED